MSALDLDALARVERAVADQQAPDGDDLRALITRLRAAEARTGPAHDYDVWKAHMRIAIMGASIARYCHDHMASGRGAPEAEDMERFKEESGALADLWESTVAP